MTTTIYIKGDADNLSIAIIGDTFAHKDALKARGYHFEGVTWSATRTGKQDIQAEAMWLKTNMPGATMVRGNAPVIR